MQNSGWRLILVLELFRNLIVLYFFFIFETGFEIIKNAK